MHRLVESAGRRGGANACEDLTSVSVSKRHLRGRITCEEPARCKRVTTTRSALRPGA